MCTEMTGEGKMKDWEAGLMWYPDLKWEKAADSMSEALKATQSII